MKSLIRRTTGLGLIIGICFITYFFLVWNLLATRLDLTTSGAATF